MNLSSIFRLVSAVAGIGGISLIVFLLINKDLIKKLIGVKLTKRQFFVLMTTILWLAFSITVLSVISFTVTTLWLDSNRNTKEIDQLKTDLGRVQTNYETLNEKYSRIDDPELKLRNPSIEALNEEVLWDLRECVEVPAEVRNSERQSAALNIKKFTLRRAYQEQKTFSITAGSSSPFEPVFSSSSHPVTVKLNTDPMPPGTDTLKRWIIDFDISQSPVHKPFELDFTGKYWNSFQGGTNDWAETAIFSPTKRATIKILFPAKRPFKKGSLVFRSYPFGRNEPREISVHPDVKIDNAGHEVTWNIKDPENGYHYRIEWQW